MNNTLETILRKLVEIPSVSGDTKASSDVADYVHELLMPTGISQTRGQLNSFPHLVATTREPNDGMIWFVSHLDVVPADNTMFTLTSDDTNYYGRGVFDMKGMAAAVLAAFVNMPEPDKTNIGLMFTTDEEIGGRSGVGALVDKDFKGAAAIVLDGSSSFVLQEKMKGILWLEIVAKGVTAHGSRPWLGQNANEDLVEYLHDFKQWYKTSMPQTAEHNYYTTFNLGKIAGGKATNQVSDEATANLDIRYVSEEDAAKIVDAANKLAKKHKTITVNIIMQEPSVTTDTASHWYKKTKAAIEKLDVKLGGEGERFAHGSTDGRYFAPLNIPVITTRSAGGKQHAEGEWASKEELAKLQELCALLMEETRS